MEAVLVDVQETKTIDAKARISYRNRIRELRSEIEAAEAMNDLGRISGLQSEYDQLINHLSSSVDHIGRARTLSASAEKARAAVTWRIRSAIKKIDSQEAQLGRHLSNSIKTGTYCSYQPEAKVIWAVC